MSQLFRRKLINADLHDSGLKKCLGAFDLVLLGVGAIIGTGIFVLTGTAAATLSGPAVVLSFVVAGIACTFAALAYAELASSVGMRLCLWIRLRLIRGIGGVDDRMDFDFGIWCVCCRRCRWMEWVFQQRPDRHWNAFATIPYGRARLQKNPGVVNLPAFSIILILMFLLIAGVRESAKLNAAMVFVKVLTIFVFVAVAVFHIQPENWSPFMPFG